MKNPLPLLRLLVVAVALAVAARAATPPDSPELAEARAKLLEMFEVFKYTDEQPAVKQQRAKIAALEYIAAAKANTGSEAAGRTVNIDFPGGTAAAMLTAIEKAGGGLNILAEADDLRIEMPRFTLRNADPSSFATAVDNLLRPRGYSLQGGGRSGAQQVPVFVLRKLNQNERYNNESQFQPFNLGPYLEYATVDDIVGAIRTAWELDPVRPPTALRVKFHPPTGILLVSGPSQGIQMVGMLLQQLRRTEPSAKPATPASEKK